MRKPASCADLLELRDVVQRVQVIGLAQPLLPHIDEADPIELTRQHVDPPETRRDRRVLPHVRIDEQCAARREHSRGLGEHLAQSLGRQMFEHVERERLGERAIRKRQFAQIADQQVDRRRASAEKNGLMSTPTVDAPQSRFHSSVRPLPQPRSTTRS